MSARTTPVERTELEVRGWSNPAPGMWHVHFAWPTNPLPMNGPKGANWRRAAVAERDVRDHAQQLIQQFARIPALGRCRALVTWWVTTNHVRDVDNLGRLEKRLFDAIVRAGVVADDRPALMVKDRAAILPVSQSAGLVSDRGFTLTIIRLDDPQGGDAA
ncbi:hypothetical protein N8K70_03760 [Microbacterium betulae]|uniref:Uncharacterized protein n=1 Tax=Microbacterium betulae TaxID=2981139 RepID=A0AA97I5J3_9MICO|nr:hypothetical protein [Microbacterium sp. AB]WOF23806.1 hypothetical protein N8K70_03760 [Microbacterium sp. AB]